MCTHVSHHSKVKYATKKVYPERPKLKMYAYILIMNFFPDGIVRNWGTFYRISRLLDLLELNLRGEELSWNVTRK